MNPVPIPCRVAACREELDDDNEWSFYLINDGDAPLDSAVLIEVDYEWGGAGSAETPDTLVTDIPPGGRALILRDDGDGAEVRMELTLRVVTLGRETTLQFEFPKLYRRPMRQVEGLHEPGFEVEAG